MIKVEREGERKKARSQTHRSEPNKPLQAGNLFFLLISLSLKRESVSLTHLMNGVYGILIRRVSDILNIINIRI